MFRHLAIFFARGEQNSSGFKKKQRNIIKCLQNYLNTSNPLKKLYILGG